MKERCATLLDDVMVRLRLPSMIRAAVASYRDLDTLTLEQLALLKHAEETAGVR